MRKKINRQMLHEKFLAGRKLEHKSHNQTYDKVASKFSVTATIRYRKLNIKRRRKTFTRESKITLGYITVQHAKHAKAQDRAGRTAADNDSVQHAVIYRPL